MTFVSCTCEKEIRELVENGQWPLASPPELRDHAAACRTCADLVLVAGAFQRTRATTIAAARPATPGAIWWRAQLRSRQQAFERIQRPLIGAQVFALVAVLLPIIGLVAFQAHNLAAWFGSPRQPPPPIGVTSCRRSLVFRNLRLCLGIDLRGCHRRYVCPGCRCGPLLRR